MHRLSICACALALAGCPIKSVGELESEDAGGGSADGTGSGEGGASAPAESSSSLSGTNTSNASNSSGTVESESTDDPSGSSTGTCVGPGTCGPSDNSQNANFVIDADVDVDSLGERDLSCTVDDVQADGDSVHVILDCPLGQAATTHTIDAALSDVVLFNIYAGRVVIFDWIAEAPFWVEEFFTLRSEEGGLILAGVHGTAVVPPGEGNEDFFAPVTVALEESGCAPDVCLNESGCFRRQRTSVVFSYEDETEVVFDNTSASLATETTRFRARVQKSELRHEIQCEDVTLQWHAWLLEEISEG